MIDIKPIPSTLPLTLMLDLDVKPISSTLLFNANVDLDVNTNIDLTVNANIDLLLQKQKYLESFFKALKNNPLGAHGLSFIFTYRNTCQ